MKHNFTFFKIYCVNVLPHVCWTLGRSEGNIGSARTGVTICGCCDLNPLSLWEPLVFLPVLQFLMYFFLFMYISFMYDLIMVWTCKYIVSSIRFTSLNTKSYCLSPHLCLLRLNQYIFYCHTFVWFSRFQTWEKRSRVCYCEAAVFHFRWLSPVPPSFLQMGSTRPFCEQINSIAYLYYTAFIQSSMVGTSVDLMSGLWEKVQQ